MSSTTLIGPKLELTRLLASVIPLLGELDLQRAVTFKSPQENCPAMSGGLHNSGPLGDGDHGPEGDETDAVNDRGSPPITGAAGPVGDGDHGPEGDETNAVDGERISPIAKASTTYTSTEDVEMALLQPVPRSQTF